MWPEQLYLTDILDAVRAIAAFCKDVRFRTIRGNDMCAKRCSAKTNCDGEAAAHLPDKFCFQNPKFMVDISTFALCRARLLFCKLANCMGYCY